MGSFFNWVIGERVAKYKGRLAVSKNSLEGLKVTTISVAGVAKTMTVSALLGGMLIYDPTGGVVALTTPTAAQIVAALKAAAVKDATKRAAVWLKSQSAVICSAK